VARSGAPADLSEEGDEYVEEEATGGRGVPAAVTAAAAGQWRALRQVARLAMVGRTSPDDLVGHTSGRTPPGTDVDYVKEINTIARTFYWLMNSEDAATHLRDHNTAASTSSITGPVPAISASAVMDTPSLLAGCDARWVEARRTYWRRTADMAGSPLLSSLQEGPPDTARLAAARATAASRAASGLGPGPAVGRRVAASVLARNWTHGGHRNELATLVEALLAWRHGARGRDVLLLCGSGGGCGAGLESMLRAVSGAGPLGRWAAAAGQEPSLGMLCSGPVGCDAPLGPPQGFALAGRAGGVAGRDAAFDLGFSHTKVVREKNYAVVTLGVTPASPAGGSSGAAAESSGGGWTGWWSGAVVGGSRMDDAHPLPHRVQADDAEDTADGAVSSADAQQASLRFDLEACGAGRFALAQLRAPPWWPRKFVAASDSKTRNTLRWLICECRGVLSHSQALGTRRRMSLCIVL